MATPATMRIVKFRLYIEEAEMSKDLGPAIAAGWLLQGFSIFQGWAYFVLVYPAQATATTVPALNVNLGLSL